MVTQAASPLLWTRRRPPLLMIRPSTEPSTTTLAPGSMIRLPSRLPRTCSVQFRCTMVSESTEPRTSDELLIKSGSACTACSVACSTPRSATGSMVAGVLCARARTADTTLGSPARNCAECRAIPVFPQARQSLVTVHIAILTYSHIFQCVIDDVCQNVYHCLY